eukprot:2224393-Rhodomonas_salina.1
MGSPGPDYTAAMRFGVGERGGVRCGRRGAQDADAARRTASGLAGSLTRAAKDSKAWALKRRRTVEPSSSGKAVDKGLRLGVAETQRQIEPAAETRGYQDVFEG